MTPRRSPTRSRRLQPCSEPGCSTLVPAGTGRCASCIEPFVRVYTDPRWNALRRDVLAEDGLCVRGWCGERAVDINHVMPLKDVLRLKLDPFARVNAEGLCKRHHSQETRAGR